MIKQLAHICIHAHDLDETARFYGTVLGLEKGFTFEREGRTFGHYFKLGADTFIEVFEGEPGDVGNINHVAIQVEDMDGLIARLREYDVDVGEKKLGADQSWQVWITDPNGVRIEFHEYTESSMQRIGGICKV